jgi:2-dehydro-3-deoxyphosphogluconate aldolase / (4S)-4-hydroxy-2-oxoglutarate aldolase
MTAPQNEKVKATILKKRLIAVIRLNDLADFDLLTEALIGGGVHVLEFTLTNMDSLKAVESLRKNLPADGEAIIGIGSVRTLEQAQQAIAVGAQFLVSPILHPQMIADCRKNGITSISGAYTPTEIATAASEGADFVKVFPADTLGPSYIKGVLAAMPDLRLVPTGGVTLENAATYLQAGCVAVGVGGALINPKMIALKDWESLRELAQQYVQAIAQ